MVQNEFSSRHNWLGKVIHCELCKKRKFLQDDMHKPEYVLENEILKRFWDFKIQTDNTIQARMNKS